MSPSRKWAIRNPLAAASAVNSPSGQRIWQVVIGLVSVLIVVGIWALAHERVQYEHDRALATELGRNDNLAQLHSQRTTQGIELFDNWLRVLRRDLLAGKLPRDLGPLLRDFGLDLSHVTVISAIGPDGYILASTAPQMQQSFADREYFQTHRFDPSDRLLVGKPIKGRLTGSWVVSLTRRIDSPTGAFGGVMFVGLDASYLASLEAGTIGPNSVLALVGRDGIARARRLGGQITYGDDVSRSMVFSQVQHAPSGHFVGRAGVDGVIRATSYRLLDNYPLIAVVSTAVDDIYEQTQGHDRAVYSTATAGSLLVLALGLTAIYMVRRNTLELARATSGARTLAEANRLLTVSESRANQLIETTPAGMLVVDDAGLVVRANAHADRMFRCEPGRLVGRRVDEFVPEAWREAHPAHRQAYAKEGATRVMGKARDLFAIRDDGSSFPILVGLARLSSDQGMQTIASIADISERKALELELERHRDTLEEQVRARTAELLLARDEAQRSANAKAQFLANMSHELRTPMNGVLGMAHLLRLTKVTSQQVSLLDKMELSGRHLLGVINNILDVSKLDAGKFKLDEHDFRLDDLVRQVTSLIEDRVKSKGLSFEVDVEPLPSPLRGDSQRLAQALLNYLDNAVKFTSVGTIGMSCRVQEQTDVDCVLRFEVSDTGIGLSPEQRSRIFEAFEQADNSTTRAFGGTGLGLTIVRGIAEQLGGGAGVVSRSGAGSTFWLTARLGKAHSQPTRQVQPEDATEALIRRDHAGKRILLVEDDEVNRELARLLLQAVGLNVVAVENGEQALKWAEEGEFALIMMDVQMPIMDGIEATIAIRKLPRHQNTPIVATTANAFAEDKQQCLDAGMDDFLAKPFDFHVMYRILLKWLEHGPRP